MSSTIEAEIDALRRLIHDEKSEFKKLIEQYDAEIETKVKEYELVLQKEFYQKYGESFRDVCIAYMEFFHQEEHLAGTDGHAFYVPIYSKSKGAFGKIVTKHGIDFIRYYHLGAHIHLRAKYYNECLPTQKIIDAFKCIGEEIYISPKISVVHWGN